MGKLMNTGKTTKKDVLRKETKLGRLLKQVHEGNIPLPTELGHNYEDDYDDDYDDDYVSQSHTEEISFIEYAIINAFLYDAYRGKTTEIIVDSYGETDSIGRNTFGGVFDVTASFWFNGKFNDEENSFIFQTKMFVDRGELVTQLHMSVKKGVNASKLEKYYKELKTLAFNNSEYKGKCIKVKLREGSFRGIEIIDMEESSNELILTDTQHKYIEHFINRVSRGGNARYLLNGEPGTGKAQPLDVKVLTPNGWTTMGEISVGCDVLTPEGKVTKVIGVYPQGVKDIYRINFKDGRSTEACGEHLWSVYGVPVGKNRKKSWSVIDTLDIKNKIENTKYRLKVPLVSNVLNNNDVTLVTPPYLMGLLLGDGSFNENSIKLSTADSFIVDKVNCILDEKYNLIHDSKYDYTLTRKDGKGYKGGDCGNDYVIENIVLGLSDKRSDTKFIPEKYKKLSFNQTIELIQGLMDSDGTCDKSSSLSYCTVSYQLAKDVQELIWSIGGIASISEKQSYSTYKGEKKRGKLAYNVNIRYANPKLLFTLERKLNNVSDTYQYSDTLKNNIVSVEYVGKKEAKCIMIEDVNHLYVTDNYIVTHNTESIREIARKLIPNVTFVIPEFTTSEDLTSIMEACEIFEHGVIVMDDIDLYLGSRDNGSYTRLLGQFLSFFDGVKKRKISLLASTNDKGLVDKAAERPGRFNFTLDFTFLDKDQIIKVCAIHLDKKWQVKEVHDALTGTVNGKKVNITGAFIANLADNIREMSEDDEEWSVEDTVSLITESYKGFYSSQVEKEKSSMGFK